MSNKQLHAIADANYAFIDFQSKAWHQEGRKYKRKIGSKKGKQAGKKEFT